MPFGISLEGINLTTAYTVNTAATPDIPGPPFTPGTAVRGTDGSEWVFVKLAASQTVAAGDFVYVSTPATFVVTLLSNTAKALLGAIVGVAGASVTSGGTSYEYMWMQVKGYRASANCLTGSVANIALHTTGTAGRVDDTAVGGTSATINGVVQTATAAGNVAPVMLNSPTIGVAD
jgi:hypothetical protein